MTIFDTFEHFVEKEANAVAHSAPIKFIEKNAITAEHYLKKEATHLIHSKPVQWFEKEGAQVGHYLEHKIPVAAKWVWDEGTHAAKSAIEDPLAIADAGANLAKGVGNIAKSPIGMYMLLGLGAIVAIEVLK